MRRLVFLLLMPLACARLTEGGARVRVVDHASETSGCTELVRLRHSSSVGGAMTRAGRHEALTELRNRAAQLGADRLLLVTSHSDPWNGTDITAEAYRCEGRRSRPVEPAASSTAQIPAHPRDDWRLRVAVMPADFDRSVESVPAKAFDEAVMTAITRAGKFDVVGQGDIDAILGFERQKELVGCDELTCFAEIGGALGVAMLVKFDLARVDGQWVVTSKAIDIRKNQVVRRSTEMFDGEADALFRAVPVLVDGLLRAKSVGDVLGQTVAEAAMPTAEAPEAASSAPREPIRPVATKP